MQTKRAVTTAMALAVVLLAPGCGGGDDGSVGDLVGGSLGEVEGIEHVVVVPNGPLTIVVGEAKGLLTGSEAADGREHVAPEGTEWVPLDWRLGIDDDLDPLQRTLMGDPSQRTTLELVAGVVTTTLGDAPGSTSTPAESRTGGPVYVIVATDSARVVEVTFDGVTASLDLGTGQVAGERAEALTDLAPPVSAVCPPLAGKRVTADVACTYTVATVPYLSGEGWAEDGWTVGQVETRIDSFERAGATYDVRAATDSSGFDGSTTGSTVVDERLTSLVTRFFVDGTPTRLDIARTLTGLRADGRGPEDATAELSTTVELD
ncbi:hypothetical protein [Nocardioides hwasunensis]|uniref:Uncharacterized protein n=1 Tax=Nocardioides hwasunensis TaxID=397258 RepID=A0ABR8MMM5_9ACTN|nr:hypothetical protein [Nocardioides hwasunensis]MBD3915334.1 hypothetical protein [Nocardioides hwasunensis]